MVPAVTSFESTVETCGGTPIGCPISAIAPDALANEKAATAKTAITASTDIPSLITALTVVWAHDPNYVEPTVK